MDVDLAIQSVAVVVAAGIPAYLNNRFLKRHVGKSNGSGTVVAMSEEMLLWAKDHSAADLAYQAHNDASVARTQRALSEIKQQIDQNTAEIIHDAQNAAEGVKMDLEDRRHTLDGTDPTT